MGVCGGYVSVYVNMHSGYLLKWWMYLVPDSGGDIGMCKFIYII